MTTATSTYTTDDPRSLKGQPLSGGMLWLAAIILASANFIAVLDMTIANVSVNTIAGSLGISSSQGTWIITSYSVAEAIAVPLTGWIAGRFGAVAVFSSAIWLFGAFSAICGFADSLSVLVFGRVMQGLAGGLMIPLSQTLLMRIFPKEKAAGAMALWAMTTLTAPVIGPIVGGMICDSYSWPLIFFINVPLALFCAPVVWRMLARYEEALIRAPIDTVGLVLMIVAVGALQLMLDLGKEHDWFASTGIIALAVIAVLGLAVLIIWELTEEHPIVDLRVFRHRGFATGVLIISLGFAAIFAGNVLTPLWLQSHMGYTATDAGLATAWSGVLAVFAAPFAGMLSAKIDQRKLICAGLSWLAFTMVLRADATTDMTYWQISIPLFLMGAGMPFFFVPLTTLALGSVEEHETASAAGMQNFLRTLSGAVATSLVTTYWDDQAQIMHAELVGLSDRNNETVDALTRIGLSFDAALQQLDHMILGQSVMIATNQLMALTTIIFAAAAALIWLAPKATRKVDMSKAGH